MDKSENKGLLATALLLLRFFFLGFYAEKKEETSLTNLNIESNQSLISESIEK